MLNVSLRRWPETRQAYSYNTYIMSEILNQNKKNETHYNLILNESFLSALVLTAEITFPYYE